MGYEMNDLIKAGTRPAVAPTPVLHIARRLARKLVKPAALWLATRALRRAEARADHLMQLRRDILPIERRERERTVRLAGRRNQIRAW